jgi:thermitase
VKRKLLWVLAATVMISSGLASAEQREALPGNDQAEPPGKLGFGFENALKPGEDFVRRELIVGLKEKEANATAGLERAARASGGHVEEELKDPKNRAVLLEFSSEQAIQEAIDALAGRSDVEFVERNGFVGGASVSSDPGVGYQWHHTVIRKTAELGALSPEPPTIAVVDTGVDYDHPDLSGKVILGPDYVNGDDDPMDDNSHGTHVAGIAAAAAGNGHLGEGVSPRSKILAIKVLGANNRGTFFDMAQGLAYARTAHTEPALRVINLSAFGSVPGYNPLLVDNEVAAIRASGKVLVAAANNDNSTTPRYPGADPDTALRVMATNQQDCRWALSNFSPASEPAQYNIAAPGRGIYSTVPGGGFGAKSGTSMATPMVSGAAALVWGESPDLSRDQLVERLVGAGDRTGCGFPVPVPRLDVRKALVGTSETALIGTLLDPATGSAPSPEATPVTAKLYSGATLLGSDATTGHGLYELSGYSSQTGLKLRGESSGYVSYALRMPISIVSGQVNGHFVDAFPQARPPGDATVTIDWKTMEPVLDTPGCSDTCNGWEFDLSVKLPASATYVGPAGNKGSLTEAPFVASPRNSLSDGQPVESVVIGGQAPEGSYAVVVEKPADAEWVAMNPSWKRSRASVQLYNGAASVGGSHKTPPSTCGMEEFWYVGDLTKSGTSYAWTDTGFCTDTRP